MCVVRRRPPLGGETVAELQVAGRLESGEHDGVGIAHVSWHAKLYRIEAVAGRDTGRGGSSVTVAHADQKRRSEIVRVVDGAIRERIGNRDAALCDPQFRGEIIGREGVVCTAGNTDEKAVAIVDIL